MKFSYQGKLLAICMTLAAMIQSRPLHAQIETDTTFNNRMNYVFGVLEKNRVPFGMLQDYAMEFTELKAFNGVSIVDSNYADFTTLSDIYNTLITSRIYSSATGLIKPSTWDSLWFVQRQNGMITLSGVFFNYSRFSDDALSGGKLTISNEQFVDRYIGGVWQNPYTTQSVFAMAPSTDYYEGKNFQVKLPSNLWFTNSSTSISNINADLGDGLGYRVLTTGQVLNINYSDTGRKEWKFKLTLTNGTILYSHSSVLIKADPYNNYNPLARTGLSDRETIPFTATQSYLGVAAQGWITIDYANADRVFRRPLIVVEGFDAGNITHPERWWGEENIDNSFFARIDNSESASLENLLGGGINQYDVVYVDWRNGTDFLQRNGLLLEDIIQWCNNNKEPLGGAMQPLVVIGQSMGGVIARWALKDMENHALNHQTRLFVNYDGPQQGANVPLGYQYLVNHARNLYVRTGAFPFVETIQLIRNAVSPIRALNIVNTPAARQLLINWVNDAAQVDNTLHSQWQTELKNMGYPNQYGIWNVAISNGSECAITQSFGPGASLLNYTGKANTRILSDMLLSLTSFGDLFVLVAIATGQPAFRLGVLPGKSEIKFEFNVNAQPFGTSDRLYHGLITYKKLWTWIIPVQVTITNKNYFANPSTLPYDYYPGGQITDGINLQNSSFANWLIKYNVTASHIQTFSFTPTPSVLDIGSGNVTLTNADYLARYIGGTPPVAPRNTPFQNFITALNANHPTINNEDHLDIFMRNGDWLASEINGIHPAANCSFICSNSSITITGPNPLCNTPLVYTLNGAPAGTTRTWSAVPSGIVSIAPSPDGSQATVTRIGAAYFTLQVTLSTPACGSGIISSSSIRAGGFGSSDYPVSGPSSACRNTYVTFTTNTLPGATDYAWFWPMTGWTYVSGNHTPTLTLITGTVNGQVGVRVANACDAGGSPGIKFVQINNCGFAFTTSPNPGTDNVTVSTNLAQGATPADATQNNIYQIKIFDQLGNVKMVYNFSGGVTTTNINISNLVAGLYTIQVYNGVEYSSKQIVKQ